jgi:DNA replication protein DnaC
METAGQIKNQLKELRLKSMLENIDARIKQAIEEKSSYLDFISSLIQDEIDLRRFEKRERRLKQAQFGRLKYLKDFDYTFNPNINKQQVMDMETCGYIREKENIIICGPTGVGKTHIAKGLGIEACFKGFTVLFTRVFKMLENIYSAKADATVNKVIRRYLNPDLLILDDWGMRPFPEHLLDILNEIISERYENGSIIITSNRKIEKWNELFSDNIIASAMMDRLLHKSHSIIVTTGKSYRTGAK